MSQLGNLGQTAGGIVGLCWGPLGSMAGSVIGKVAGETVDSIFNGGNNQSQTPEQNDNPAAQSEGTALSANNLADPSKLLLMA